MALRSANSRAFGAGQRQRPQAARPRLTVACRASAATPGRRELLQTGAAAAAAALLQAGPASAAMREMSVSSLSTFQKGAQRTAFQAAAEAALKPVFGAADAPGLFALMLHDAATYDAEAKAGGFDGSILISSEELGRPENAALKPLAERLKAAKPAVDAAVTALGSPAISYADLLVLATKVATTAAWKEVKMKRVQTTSGGEIITSVYGTDWPVRLGRLDSAAPGPAGRLPPAGAPVADVVAFMKQLGAKPGAGGGPFTPKPPFWERPTFFVWPAASADPAAEEARFVAELPDAFAGAKADADRSRGTLTRTDYEVEFINAFTKLAATGAVFDPDAYLHPEETLALNGGAPASSARAAAGRHTTSAASANTGTARAQTAVEHRRSFCRAGRRRRARRRGLNSSDHQLRDTVPRHADARAGSAAIRARGVRIKGQREMQFLAGGRARLAAPAGARQAQAAAIARPAAPARALQRRQGASPRQLAAAAPPRAHARRVAAASSPAPGAVALQAPGQHLDQVNVVYKFGGSSVRDAERMREVADIICSFPDNLPVVVLSAMGKTTNMLLECGELALSSPTDAVPNMAPLRAIRELHLETCDALGVEPGVRAEVEALLSNLQQLLIGISIMQDLTPRAKDSLLSFGERLSTRIFASYLRSRGVPAGQHDAPEMGLVTTDDFGNADVIYEDTLSKVKASLTQAPGGPRAVQVVTGFLGKAKHSGAVTTLGRGGSDLSATVIGAAMELREVQVWKDVDGVLSSDPRIVPGSLPVTELTYEEATELAFFGAQVLHPLAMQPAIRSKAMAVRVKNSYNRAAPGTLITKSRDMACSLVTSIVLKNNVTLVDIVSSRMLGQFGFLANVFDVFRANQVSVDVVATSEVSISLSLDPKKSWSDGEVGEELSHLVYELEKISSVRLRSNMCILSLICNVERTSEILLRTFRVLIEQGINVSMMSQGASKVNISLVVDGSEGTRAVQALHREFFEDAPACAPAAAGSNGNGAHAAEPAGSRR
ncbi:AK1 [Scenedesmus sp. PABB004]|nr:AK1 [Scenedesmus sp. PABB004]